MFILMPAIQRRKSVVLKTHVPRLWKNRKLFLSERAALDSHESKPYIVWKSWQEVMSGWGKAHEYHSEIQFRASSTFFLSRANKCNIVRAKESESRTFLHYCCCSTAHNWVELFFCRTKKKKKYFHITKASILLI